MSKIVIAIAVGLCVILIGYLTIPTQICKYSYRLYPKVTWTAGVEPEDYDWSVCENASWSMLSEYQTIRENSKHLNERFHGG